MDCDFLVIGAGIAGASAGSELARRGKVVILEREDAPGYHSTGRSAAMFTETYGPEPIRRLTMASAAFMRNPPAGFTEFPLLRPRSVLFVARADQLATLDGHEKSAKATGGKVRRLEPKEMLALAPVLRADYVGGGMIEPDAADLDVSAVHQGFLRTFKTHGGQVVCDAEVRGIERKNGAWAVRSKGGDFTAKAIVNAAGAWCDEIAKLAGIKPLGLVPKRRTAFTFDPPAGVDVGPLPLCYDVDEQFYFKPDAGRFLGSLADETPSPPCDAQPEDIDVAMAVERIEAASTLKINRLVRKWAGLRSFFKDKTPVVGPDPAAPSFIWVAGQGGYGIQTSPSLGRIAAAFALGEDLPADIAATGLKAADIAPGRTMIAAGH
ncbi:MAG: FAD-binding oxidoreductase [Alphaproteobacteria bacterium]|nr:FAD-binding oxidoreductase [Alphaproteobacteria bacterium]